MGHAAKPGRSGAPEINRGAVDLAGHQALRFGMIVKRIVPNISATDFSKARWFYGDILGLETGMDLGWIVTFASSQEMTMPQVSVATEGGSGTAVPDLSIEVDDLDEAVHRIQAAGFAIEYGPTTEEWGVRRFYVRDPFGKLLNILSHT